MVVRQSQPSVRKLPDPIAAIDRPWIADGLPSPTSPLERDARSPRGWRNRDSDGVGLAIVAALGGGGGGGAGSSAAAAPIPVAIGIGIGAAARSGGSGYRGRFEVAEAGGCGGMCAASACGRPGAGLGFGEIDGEVGAEFPLLDFLSCCYLCRKRLHGKDIYMYRGEKAFCSMECRYRHIVSDECQESFGGTGGGLRKSTQSEIAAAATSPYSGAPLFFTGVVAA